MLHPESLPVSTRTLRSHSCSYSESTLLESYVFEASEAPEPTITTNTTSNDHDREHPPTTTAGTTTAAATPTAHLLSHMHFSPNPNPNYPNHQTIHYPHPPFLISSPTRTLPPTVTTNLHDLHQSLLPVLSHDIDLLLREQPLAVLVPDERSVKSIPTEEFLPRPYEHFPPEAEEHEPGAGRTVQDGYAIQRFLDVGMGEEANVVYARSVRS